MIACLQCGAEMAQIEGQPDASIFLNTSVFICPKDGQIDDAPIQIARLVFAYVAKTLDGEMLASVSFEPVALEGEDAYPPELPQAAIRLYAVTITHRAENGGNNRGYEMVFVAQHADGWLLYEDDFPTCAACGEYAFTQDGHLVCRDDGPLDADGCPVEEPQGVEA